MNITCHVCGSSEIRFLKQKRRDGVWVVTARCKHEHIPEKGKPFYSIKDFDLNKLPPLIADTKEEQKELFKKQDDFVKSLFEQPKKNQPYRNYPFPVEEK